MAAYGLLKLERPVAPLYQPQYDIRIISTCLKMLGTDRVKTSGPPPHNSLNLNVDTEKLLEAFNAIPAAKDDDVIY